MKDEKKILSEPQEICGKRYGVPFYAQNCGGGIAEVTENRRDF